MREPQSLRAAPGAEIAQTTARWVDLLEHDDDAALTMAPPGPIELRLCLPACWLRARGDAGFEDYLGGLLEAASGQERALLAVAAGRLHPAALGLAGSPVPRQLFLAAAQGARLGRRPADARRWFAHCAAPTAEAWLVRLCAIEGGRPVPHGVGGMSARASSPAGPPAHLVSTLIERSMERGAAALSSGQPHAALGWFEIAFATGGPPGATAGLRVAAGELRCLLGQLAEAKQDLDAAGQAPTLAPGETAALRLAQARLALEQDDAIGAAAALRAWIEGAPAEQDRSAALSLLGAAEAALGRWAEADEQQMTALAAQLEQGGEEGAVAGGCFHWLGLGQLSRGQLAEAEALLRRASELRGAALWPGHPDHAGSLAALAAVLAARGRLTEAERLHREALSLLHHSLAAEDHRVTLATSRLAELLLARRRWEEAEPLVLELLAWAASSGASEELGRWREASEQVRTGQAQRGGAGAEEPIAEAIGTAPLDDERLLQRLATFAGYVVLLHRESGGFLTLAGHEGLASGALVFTDRALADAFLAQAPGEVRGWFEPMTMDGYTLFRQLPGQQVDGLIFNCLGPWPRAAPLDLCAAALGAP